MWEKIGKSLGRPVVISKTKAAFLLGIFVLAFGFRVWANVRQPVTIRGGLGPFGDSVLYHRAAYNLYTGHGFSGTDDWRAFGLSNNSNPLVYKPIVIRGPAYPFFISCIYKFWGDPADMRSFDTWHKNWDKVRLAQCFLDALTCLLVFFIVGLVMPRTLAPAVIAAVLYCFSFYNIFYTRALLSESLTTFLVTIFLLSCLWSLRVNRTLCWVISGILLGLLSLARTEYLPFVLIVGGIIFVANKGIPIIALKKILLFCLGVSLAVLPWTLRNYNLFKKVFPVSTGGVGIALYLGTFDGFRTWPDWFRLPESIFYDQKEKADFFSALPLYMVYSVSGGIEVDIPDKLFKDLALKRIRRDPCRCLKSWLLKIPRLWYQNRIPSYLEKEASGNFFIFYFIFATAAFCLVGNAGARLMMTPVVGLLIYFTVIFLPLYVEPRYSVAVMPAIISLSGIGVYAAGKALAPLIKRSI